MEHVQVRDIVYIVLGVCSITSIFIISIVTKLRVRTIRACCGFIELSRTLRSAPSNLISLETNVISNIP